MVVEVREVVRGEKERAGGDTAGRRGRRCRGNSRQGKQLLSGALCRVRRRHPFLSLGFCAGSGKKADRQRAADSLSGIKVTRGPFSSVVAWGHLAFVKGTRSGVGRWACTSATARGLLRACPGTIRTTEDHSSCF